MMDRRRQILCVLSEEPNAHNAGGTDLNKSADLFGLMAKQTKQKAKGKVRVEINWTGRANLNTKLGHRERGWWHEEPRHGDLEHDKNRQPGNDHIL